MELNALERVYHDRACVPGGQARSGSRSNSSTVAKGQTFNSSERLLIAREFRNKLRP
jgi:hypothetical protein